VTAIPAVTPFLYVTDYDKGRLPPVELKQEYKIDKTQKGVRITKFIFIYVIFQTVDSDRLKLSSHIKDLLV
jgi:hypothetical protein